MYASFLFAQTRDGKGLFFGGMVSGQLIGLIAGVAIGLAIVLVRALVRSRKTDNKKNVDPDGIPSLDVQEIEP